jgi:ATP-dependent RNA helicase DHX37/DHR1
LQRWNVPKRKLSHGAGESDYGNDDAASSFDSSDSALDEGEDSDGEESEWGGIADGDNEEAGTEESGEGSEDEGESSSSSEEMEGTEEDMPESTKPRFKDWAKRQVEIARGFADVEEHPSTNTSQPEPHSSNPNPAQPSKFQPLAPSSHTLPSILSGPLGSTLQTTQSSFAQTILPLLSHPSLKPLPPVIRKASINEARLSLPIMDEEQQIMETILLNNVVVLQGETGSGKTSQVVQFLWEGGFGRQERAYEGQADEEGPVVGGGDSSTGNGKNGKKKVGRKGVGFGGMIGITQPRRVAAISMSARVSEELTPPHPVHSKQPTPQLPPSPVAHQIRYSASLTPHTRIKFMTEGILLRELSGDFLLRKYSVLVLDEAHERSLGVDVLLGCLTRVVGLREKLWREDENVDGWRVQVSSPSIILYPLSKRF